jgi:hypothetical protein
MKIGSTGTGECPGGGTCCRAGFTNKYLDENEILTGIVTISNGFGKKFDFFIARISGNQQMSVKALRDGLVVLKLPGPIELRPMSRAVSFSLVDWSLGL